MENNQKIKKIYETIKKNPLVFIEKFLKIRNKNFEIKNLKLNKEQKYIHLLLEKQKKEKGNIKALILKGRQIGVTTYIAARFYYTTLLNIGVKTFIMTHKQSATGNIYDMVNRFYNYSPFFLILVLQNKIIRSSIF